MNTNAATRTISSESSDYRLLLDRLQKASLDENGKAFVRQSLNEQKLLAHIDAPAMLQVAVIAQQHGLIDQGLAVFEQLNTRFPDFTEGWKQHLELLDLLGDRRAMVRGAGQGSCPTPGRKDEGLG